MTPFVVPVASSLLPGHGRRELLASTLSQDEPLDLAARRFGQLVHEVHRARIRMGGVAGLDMLQPAPDRASGEPAPGSRGTTYASSTSPRMSSGTAITAHSATAGWLASTDSTSNGPIR